MEISCSVSSPPLGALFAIELLISKGVKIKLTWGKDSSVKFDGKSAVKYETQNDLLRIIAKKYPEENLYGSLPMDRITVDHWLSFSSTLNDDYANKVKYLDNTLDHITYLSSNLLTIADFAVCASLHMSSSYNSSLKSSPPKNVLRWMNLINAQPFVKKTLDSLPKEVKENIIVKNVSSDRGSTPVDSTGRLQEGKFINLPGAEMGKVIVRFPPEASGYLHIGHAKAALLNQYYQQAFQGKLIMRFDDTNPAKENVHFEKVILEDVQMLDIKPDLFTHTSQYFDLMLEMCERLIKEQKAFVDDTPAEQMKLEREQKVESSNRNNSIEKNLKMWNEMKAGSETGVKFCVRAKIDMQSANGCMRDPTIYRCKPEPHPRTGTEYKVYPTYDFACPIVDSIEDVTHVLRTTEYHDRDPQFFWFIDALKLRKPYIWEYSRLSMTNTVLSKRKLTWFVEEGLVDGWDDPRFPTVRGVLRRGMTVEGLKQFIIAQGSSQSVVFMEWDKIWAFNKKVIDPIAPRYTALETVPKPVVVNVKNTKVEKLTVPCHPKNPDVGNKSVWVGPKILIDQTDAQTLKEGENATFINWGNIKIDKIHKAADGSVMKIDATSNLEDKDYKKTLKLTWLADVQETKFTPTFCVFFDHIISKAVLSKDEDFKQYIGHNTRTEVAMLGDPELASLKKGDTIQLQRRGFFKVDVAYQPASDFSGKAQPCILFHIPDGHAKEQPTLRQSKAPTAEETSKKSNKVSEKQKTPPPAVQSQNKSNNSDAQLLELISKHGDKIRQLKEQKADKPTITAEVAILLALKADYKSLTGSDWTPNSKPSSSPPAAQSNQGDTILNDITTQGDKIRQLKQNKADKTAIDTEVKVLLALKAKYKTVTGTEWTPNTKPSVSSPPPPVKTSSSTDASIGDSLLNKISAQGDKIRQLKQDKADKKTIDPEVQVLLSLKAEFKKATGSDWTPNIKPASVAPETKMASNSGDDISDKIASQGDKVRQLKQEKADKKAIDVEVKILLELKAEYKKVSGKDWTPKPASTPVASVIASAPKSAPVDASLPPAVELILTQISQQGDKIRNLKQGKADKATVDPEIQNLLGLKAEYKKLTGKDWTPNTTSSQNKGAVPKVESKPRASKTPDKTAKPAAKPEKHVSKDDQAGGLKKQTRLGLEAKKETDLPDWYAQVITKGEMIEYYDVSGCYILRPWSYSIWDIIRNFLTAEIRKLGVKDCYFPIFVSKAALEREKDHIADFAPEVAWVTRSGESELAEHIAVRPTSETVMYPSYAKWIQSYRDLPLKLNQWNNVVRWEFQHPQPFLRSREFLWQEGHTAFSNKEEADVEVLQILELYARVYIEFLALPVIRGKKTEKEKFAGGDYTTTVEAFVPASGRGIQGGTSHHLGQNFSKMFEIVYDDPETQEKKYVYQNSWGLTTRTIGVMIMVHGDNQGLVLPPRVAAVQSIIVPCGITASTTPEDKKKLLDSCSQLEKDLLQADVRVEGDYRDNYSPGWKFNHWELKGVPIRIELGPKDMAQGQLVAVRRDSGAKVIIKRETAVADIVKLLETIQSDMLTKATVERDARLKQVENWEQFNEALDGQNIMLAPFCGRIPCEDSIKKDSARMEVDPSSPEAKMPAMGAKALCIPFQQPRALSMQDKCVHPSCTEKPRYFTLFGRSY